MNPDSRFPLNELDPKDPRVWLSALADGEAQAADRACSHWRDDAAARQTWHAYHLIGDVMRSDDLASSPRRDADFMAGVRQRLAAEPVVLAPAPVADTAGDAQGMRRRQAWLLPAAAAAGFAVVATVMVVSRLGDGAVSSTAPVMAAASSAGQSAAMPLALRQELPSTPTTLVSGQDGFVRDPRLDEFLRAHQSIRGGTMVVAPGGTLRRVDVEVPAGAAQR